MSKSKVRVNRAKRQANLNILNEFEGLFNLQFIEIKELTPYQFRLSKNGRKIDYYPTNSKYFDLNNQVWGTIEASNLINFFR